MQNPSVFWSITIYDFTLTYFQISALRICIYKYVIELLIDQNAEYI